MLCLLFLSLLFFQWVHFHLQVIKRQSETNQTGRLLNCINVAAGVNVITHGLHFHTNQSRTVTYLRWQVIRSNSTLNKMMHIVESWNLWPFKSLEVFLPDTDQSCRIAPELRSVRHLAPHNKPQERSRASGCAVNLFSDWKYKGREIEKQLSTKKVVWNGISKENPWKARFSFNKAQQLRHFALHDRLCLAALRRKRSGEREVIALWAFTETRNNNNRKV